MGGIDTTFEAFGLTLYRYGAAACISALVYLAACSVLRYRRGLPTGTTRVYAMFAFPLGLVCARALFCLINLGYFTESISQPLMMLRFRDGGYSMTGMLMGLLLAALIAAKIMKVRAGDALDVTAAPIGILICGLRLAERYTSLGVGRYVEAPELAERFPMLFVMEKLGNSQMTSLAVYRYEAVLAAMCFIIMLFVFFSEKRGRSARPGDITLISYALYGATQVLMESMRNDGHMMLGFVRMAQIAAILMPMIAITVFSARLVSARGLGPRAVISWLIMLVCAAVGVALEFSLDGRLALNISIPGMSPAVRDYILMAMICAALFLTAYGLWRTLIASAYREKRYNVRIDGRPGI